MTPQEKAFSVKLLNLFKLDGKPAGDLATEGQLEIFFALITRKHSRLQIIASTQYGKSLFVALACVVLACVQGEIVSIIAPTNDKAKIIMRYFIKHLSDHPLFYSQLEKDNSVEKLQQETTKDRIILKNKGGIFLLSVQAGNTRRGFEAAMGEGSRTVILDESALVPDEIEATVFRMIAGKSDAMYVKIGNPFYRNHFYRTSRDPRYHQIRVDYHRGLTEGRYSSEFIEEARLKPYFEVLFGCVFPETDTIDLDGYRRLFSEAEIDNAYSDYDHDNLVILGIDPGAGGDESTIVRRSGSLCEILYNQPLKDTMSLIGIILSLHRSFDALVVDKTGVGQGLYDRLREMNYNVIGINFGEKSTDDKFANRKAELYWNFRDWTLRGGKWKRQPGFEEWQDIKYKIDSSGKIKIQPKEDLARMGIKSPNVVDASVLTLAVTGQGVKNARRLKQGHVWYDRMTDIWQGK